MDKETVQTWLFDKKTDQLKSLEPCNSTLLMRFFDSNEFLQELHSTADKLAALHSHEMMGLTIKFTIIVLSLVLSAKWSTKLASCSFLVGVTTF